MTTIEKIKQANAELVEVLNGVVWKLPDVDGGRLTQAIDRLSYLQAEAIRQATEVADENFARAQKLSEQVQENVRHIERLATRRGETDAQICKQLEEVMAIHSAFIRPREKMPVETAHKVVDKIVIALAWLRGEEV